MNIPDEAFRQATAVYTETIVDLRLKEGGGFKVASQQRRAIRAALEAAAPHIAAQTLREASDAYPLETAYGGAEHAVTWLKQRADQIQAVPEGAAFRMDGEEAS